MEDDPKRDVVGGFGELRISGSAQLPVGPPALAASQEHALHYLGSYV
jgi:hypothetical protein